MYVCVCVCVCNCLSVYSTALQIHSLSFLLYPGLYRGNYWLCLLFTSKLVNKKQAECQADFWKKWKTLKMVDWVCLQELGFLNTELHKKTSIRVI